MADQDVLNTYYSMYRYRESEYAIMPCNFNYRFNPDHLQCYIIPSIIMHCNNYDFHNFHYFNNNVVYN